LRFVVEQTLTGQGDNLKEQVLALELYGRGADFDSGADPIVRVDARRLRDKLREYYVGAPADPIVISLPKGGYVPVFEQGNAARLMMQPAPEATVPPGIGEGRSGRQLVSPPWRWPFCTMSALQRNRLRRCARSLLYRA
jgi:hypothetical protein